MKPLISCLMPTKGRPEMAGRAIAQFHRQTYPQKELIVIDDETRSHRSITAYGALDSRTLDGGGMLVTREDGPLGHKLNVAAQLARGEILLNWDDDDYYAPDRIQRQLEAFELGARPVSGLSSLIYWSPGWDYGWEYFADAFYCPGGTHMRYRDYQLKYPRPEDMTRGEDDHWIAGVYARNEVSTISGMRVYVALNHTDHTSDRSKFEDSDFWKAFGVPDNFRRIPFSDFGHIVQG